MLHIHNGDSTANTMKEAGFPGEHFPFREALASGPVPGGLSTDDWIRVRAGFLTGVAGLDTAEIEKDLFAIDAALERITDHEEVILWFEHDLFCQVNLVYLLDRFSQKDLGRSRLSLICIDKFPGVENFRGLGQLTGEQMASLFDARHEVSKAEMALAQGAWSAFTSADPKSIEALLAADTSALPFLRKAFEMHLARYPSVRNGLSHAENRLLELIATGTRQFGRLCAAFFDAEPGYGLGDGEVWRDLTSMAQAPRPLVTIEGASATDHASPKIHKASCDITDDGKQVLAGKADFLEANGIDVWLGGVHLRPDNLWRWDEQQRTLVRAVA